MRGRISLSKGFFPLLFSSLLMVLCLAGCAEDSNILDNGKSRQLEFSVTTCGWNSSNHSSSDSKKDSRATPISGNTFDTSKSFNMIADQNDESGNYSTLIDKESVSYSNNIWKTTKDYYWSGNSSKTINFYAYYPTSISSSISHTAGSAPTLSYTVPDDVANQPDIIVASKDNVAGNTTASTDLTFNHIFAAVNFQVGSSGLPSGTISSITISGIKNSGNYTFGSGWTLNSDTKTFTISPSMAINGTSGESITTGTYTLMMIPQIFSNAVITLIYNTGTSYTKTISGTWIAGNTYTYNLSKPVNIGDYYYSDGTWGSIAEHTNSTASPIGVIFSNSTSNIDKGHNWTQGYAMALQNAGSGTTTYQWYQLYTSNSGNPTGTCVVTADQIMSDKDGYAHTEKILETAYAASIAARSYTAKDKNGNTVTATGNTSGWYLPSIGQWYDICTSLGGMVAASGKSYTNSDTGWLRWDSEDDNSGNNYSSLCASDLNGYLNALRSEGYCVDLFSNNDEHYWSSSEWTNSWACYVGFYSKGFLHLGGSFDPKVSFSVRPVVAF